MARPANDLIGAIDDVAALCSDILLCVSIIIARERKTIRKESIGDLQAIVANVGKIQNKLGTIRELESKRYQKGK